MAKHTGEALLSKCTLIWIGRDEHRFNEFLHSDNVLPLHPLIKSIVMHPDPCFPKTWTDPQTGRRVISAVELGDCMSEECWKKSMYETASCGALQSHRRAWHIADLLDRTGWCMFIEDDITLRANAADQIQFAFDCVAKSKIASVMLNFVPGGSAQHQNYIRDNCQQLASHAQHTEIRAYPFLPGPKKELRAKHVGYGLKFYALAPEARRVLKQHIFQMTAWEMEIFKTVATQLQIWGKWNTPNAVGCLLPGVGEHTRDFKDFHLGSGRFRTDRGHAGGPYVYVDIKDETDLGLLLFVFTRVFPSPQARTPEPRATCRVSLWPRLFLTGQRESLGAARMSRLAVLVGQLEP